jgi:preprotein translocase subunit SecA
MDELRNDPNGMLANALERLREYKELGGSEEREAPSESPVAISNEDDASRNEFEAEPATPSHQKTGRNDPCPCGSGKKYKRCCLKKRNDGSLFD